MWISGVEGGGAWGLEGDTIFYIILAPSELFKCKCTSFNGNVRRSKVSASNATFLPALEYRESPVTRSRLLQYCIYWSEYWRTRYWKWGNYSFIQLVEETTKITTEYKIVSRHCFCLSPIFYFLFAICYYSSVLSEFSTLDDITQIQCKKGL